jgi:hypothetical protein
MHWRPLAARRRYYLLLPLPPIATAYRRAAPAVPCPAGRRPGAFAFISYWIIAAAVMNTCWCSVVASS